MDLNESFVNNIKPFIQNVLPLALYCYLHSLTCLTMSSDYRLACNTLWIAVSCLQVSSFNVGLLLRDRDHALYGVY